MIVNILNNKSAKAESILPPMCADSIRNYLANHGVDNIESIEVLSSVTSTNDYLAQKEFIHKNKISICIADQQTQGRGRFGHRWWSPPGVNLYLSMLWPLKKWGKEYETLGLWLLIAIAGLLEQLGFASVQLKWPNDICVQNKKLGGILIERRSNHTRQCLIIGMGLNIAMSKVSNLQSEPAWVDLISIKPDWTMSRDEFAAQVITSLKKILVKLENNSLDNLSSVWSRYDVMYQRKIEFTYQNQRTTGVAKGIDELGQIIIEVNEEILHLHSAHVSEIRT